MNGNNRAWAVQIDFYTFLSALTWLEPLLIKYHTTVRRRYDTFVGPSALVLLLAVCVLRRISAITHVGNHLLELRFESIELPTQSMMCVCAYAYNIITNPSREGGDEDEEEEEEAAVDEDGKNTYFCSSVF